MIFFFLLCEKWKKEQQIVWFGLTVGESCYQWQNESVDEGENNQLGHFVMDSYPFSNSENSCRKIRNLVEVKGWGIRVEMKA